MTQDLQLIVLSTGFLLIALTLLLVVLSARADQAVTIKGPMATIEELEARIAAKREDLLELDGVLEQRRKAMANIAEILAEIDAYNRQRDEILTELAQLKERKQEILDMRAETDTAHTKLAEVIRDLSEKSAELDGVQAKLNRAERLMDDLQAMNEEHTALDAKLTLLREDLANLKTAQAREEELRRHVEKLERDTARLQGEMESFQQQCDNTEARARASLEHQAEIETKHIDAATRLEGAEAEVRQTQSQLSRMEDQRAELEARLTHLKSEVDGHSGTGVGGAGGKVDPKSALYALPPVLVELSKRKEWDSKQNEGEVGALLRVHKHMKAVGLQYPRRVIHAFHTAMKVNETTQMAVLAGISGTGKSQMPRRYAEAMGIGFLQVPVQPRWDSPQDLMGFYNYIEGKFRPTDMAQALYHLDSFNGPTDGSEFQDRMMMVLLDEMNLARVEYYFSDFLSRLESRPGRADLDNFAMRKDSEIELDIPTKEGETTPRIFPGYNVLFAGTMNEDESTQSLSDKVVDRANVLHFAAPKVIRAEVKSGKEITREALSLSDWNKWVRGTKDLANSDAQRVKEHVSKMVDHMRKLQRPIGHRLGRAIMAYVANYPEVDGGDNTLTALADQVEMRLLPKLRGVEIDSFGSQLRDFAAYVERDLVDSELADAFKDAIDFAENGTGQFVWRGVTRE